MSFADQIAADMAAITSGEFATAANWDGSDVSVVPIEVARQVDDRGRNGVADECEVLVTMADVPKIWYRQRVTMLDQEWDVARWDRENEAAYRVTLRRINRPVI